MGTTESPEYNLSPREAGAYLGVHSKTIKRWVAQGKLSAFRTPGGWYRFRQSDLDALVGNHEAAS